jgi:outer membrane murein-binding lipoprotein Lpp
MLRRIAILVCVLGLVATVVACSGPDKTLTTNVTDLTAKVTALQTKVDAATAADTSLRTDLTAAQNTVKQLTTRVTTLETALQNHINPPLVLEIKSLTSPVLQGGKVTLVAKADPGARVAISLKLPTGQAQPGGLGEKTADKNGQVTWAWTVAKTLPAGSYPILIASSYEGKTASQSTNLVVTAPAPAPAPVKK